MLGENHRERWGKVSHWGLNAGVAGRRASRRTLSPPAPSLLLTVCESVSLPSCPRSAFTARLLRAEQRRCRSPGTQNQIKSAHSTVSGHGLKRAPAQQLMSTFTAAQPSIRTPGTQSLLSARPVLDPAGRGGGRFCRGRQQRPLPSGGTLRSGGGGVERERR